MSDEHDRHGEPAAPDGERTEAEPGAEPDDLSGPAAGGDRRPEAGEEPRLDGDPSRVDLDAMGEDALRHLLRDSVRDLEPSPDALEHLRRAVPARRARRRQVVVGAAAALLVCSVAVPAMLHADFGPIGDKPMHNAGHAQDHVAEQEQSVGDQGRGPARGDGRDGPLGRTDGGAESGAPTVGGSAGPDPSSSLGPVSPTCTRDQLGGGKAVRGEADAQGRVYGSFTVVNTSDTSCTVEGDGIVLATAQGGARSTMVQVVDHTTGDQATGLPDPVMTASDEVVLKPDGAYVVQFAWIPREGGGTTGCATSSPSPGGDGGEGTETSGGQQPMGSSDSLDESSGSGGTGTEGGDGTDAGSGGGEGSASGGTAGGDTDGGTGEATGGEGDGDGTAPSAGVIVTHTPDVGDPVAGQVEISGACAGTLYRTGVLPAA